MNKQQVKNALSNATNYQQVRILTDSFSAPEKAILWEMLDNATRDRIKMLKEFNDHPITRKFPIGSKVRDRRWDEDAVATVTGWAGDSRPIVKLWIEHQSEQHLKTEQYNASWGFSFPENLVII